MPDDDNKNEKLTFKKAAKLLFTDLVDSIKNPSKSMPTFEEEGKAKFKVQEAEAFGVTKEDIQKASKQLDAFNIKEPNSSDHKDRVLDLALRTKKANATHAETIKAEKTLDEKYGVKSGRKF